MGIHPHYLDILRGVHFILLNNMPIHPIGIRLNGWDEDSSHQSISSFKFHSKFKVLPNSNPVPLKTHSFEPELVSPIKQIIDQTKEDQKRNNNTSESSIKELNMHIAKPKRKAIKLSRKNDINILAYPKQGHLLKHSRKRKTETKTQSKTSKTKPGRKKDPTHSPKKRKSAN